jgi:hypothetical protein
VKKNGDEIKSKILEITSSEIKFKDFDFQDGPIRNVAITEVFMIIYENGKRETINKKEVANTEVINNRTSNTQVSDEYKGNYFMLGTGFGNSYGGVGVRAQWRRGGIQGFGWHVGVGYFPDAPVLASAGVKYFPYKDLYINAQFGLVGYEQTYNYSGYNDSELLYGPSMLIGGDWTWGGKVGFGFNAGAGVTYNLNYFEEFTVAMDLGFLIRF